MKHNPELLDQDNPLWTEETFKKARPASEVLPGIVAAAQKRGRPKLAETKQSTTIRLSPEVIEFFKEGGSGWQSRINEALKEYVKEHEHS